MNKRQPYTLIFTVIVLVASAAIWSLSFILSDATSLLITIGTFVPSVIGLMLARKQGKAVLKKVLQKTVEIPKHLQAYILIFVPLPLVVLLSYLIMQGFNLDPPEASFALYELPLVFIVILLTMGPLAEELGWRGFLLPRLLTKHSVLASGIIVGLIWSVWHIPLFFINDALQASFVAEYGFALAFLGYTFNTVLLSLFITTVFIHTKASIFVAVLIHTVANMSIGVMPIVFSQTGALIQLSVMTIIVIGIYLVYGKKKTILEEDSL